METSASPAAGEPDAESTPNLGTRLQNAREAQDLSIEELAAELRIGAHFLTALEECRFDVLGAPVFAKGYLKQYGARLGLDATELAADYVRAVGHASIPIAPSKTIKLRDDRQITMWVIAGIALVLLASLLLLWWLRQSDIGAESALADRARATVTVPAGAPEFDSPVREVPAAAATPAELLPAQDLSQEQEPELVAEPAVEPAAASRPGPELTPAVVPPPVAEAPPAAVIDGPVLEVLFVEDSWAEILDEDGTRLFYDLGRAGTRQRFPAGRNLNLLFGNARGVELSVDGRPVPVPGSPRRGDVAQFDLNALID
jgi:cytoskeleton protein RodZ